MDPIADGMLDALAALGGIAGLAQAPLPLSEDDLVLQVVLPRVAQHYGTGALAFGSVPDRLGGGAFGSVCSPALCCTVDAVQNAILATCSACGPSSCSPWCTDAKPMAPMARGWRCTECIRACHPDRD
jgi:hypothetical protein